MIGRRSFVLTLALCSFLFPLWGDALPLGNEAWLRYAPITDPVALRQYAGLPAVVSVLGQSPVLRTAQGEWVHGVRGMLRRTLREEKGVPAKEDAFVLGTSEMMARGGFSSPTSVPSLPPSGFRIRETSRGGHHYWLIEGADDTGMLYGVFHLLERIAQLYGPAQWPVAFDAPAAPIRWVNQWDNWDGSIERGYAGRSIFFENGTVRADLTRTAEYARLLASVGLNGCTINNVNADLHMLATERLTQVARVADVFRPWGVHLSLAVDLSSPQAVGALSTFDPLDPNVSVWWRHKADEIYRLIPDFAGFVVKADSEGRVGPSQYGRTPADAANVLARALQPHNGLVLYRGFVYNHHLNWQDPKADRARAGYDNFRALDGQFEPNVIVQIKHGPIDFQVREPVSPLFAALPKTNQAIELQITQEYTGQQRHLVFLVPMWKTALDTDLRVGGQRTLLRNIITGKTFARRVSGFVGVANVGLDQDWLRHPLAMANLYGFGKLAWNPEMTSEEIARTWTRLTFGNNRRVVDTITGMQLASWPAYENYTGPLGAGTLTDIIHVHYGPGIESSERNGWGQWHRADNTGIGMDRTTKTGTGYSAQYPPELARVYESLQTTPDNLLLFMHHVPYMYQLQEGKTVIQHIYDTHYAGAAQAAHFVEQWQSLHGEIEELRYRKTLDLLQYQAGHAIEWRDAVCTWFHKTSGIADEKGRVGHYPDRTEAEAMQLRRYQPTNITPWETASNGKAVVCQNVDGQEGSCSAAMSFEHATGWYDLAIQYFAPSIGTAHYKAWVNDQEVAHWTALEDLPSAQLDGHTAVRFTLSNVALRRGDTLRIVGTAQNGNPAALDYVEVMAHQSSYRRME